MQRPSPSRLTVMGGFAVNIKYFERRTQLQSIKKCGETKRILTVETYTTRNRPAVNGIRLYARIIILQYYTGGFYF